MAKRPVFVTLSESPFWKEELIEFEWHKGLSKTQKQKNVLAMHDSFKNTFPQMSVLEISSKSLQPGGAELSAFSLKKYVPSLNTSIPVECIYQGGKVFCNGGPYLDLYLSSPKNAKTDGRLQESGELYGYYYETKSYPTKPPYAFYNYIYIMALKENPDLATVLLDYAAFTDIEFGYNTGGINCQARAAAQYVSFVKLGLIERVVSFESYVQLLTG